MKIHVFTSSASDSSLSRKAADHVFNTLKTLNVDVAITDIRNLKPTWVNDRDIEDYDEDYQRLYGQIEESDGVVFTFPIYNYTMSSPFKAISEIIGDALENKPVSFIVAAGSVRSHLAVGDAFNSMIFEQESLCFPKYVMVTKEDFGQNGELNSESKQRIHDLAGSFTNFVERNSFSESCPVFTEIYVADIQSNISFFENCLDFRLIRDEGDFAELRHKSSIFLLNSHAQDIEGHFFNKRIDPSTNGIGTEIGIFVKNIEEVYSKVEESRFYKSITGLKKQSWGMIDFRVVTKDNYYLRVTERISH